MHAKLSQSIETPSKIPATVCEAYGTRKYLDGRQSLHFSRRIGRRDRQRERRDRSNIHKQKCPGHRSNRVSRKRTKPRGQFFSPHSARRIEHRISGGHVVAAALGHSKNQQRRQVHPTQHAEAPPLTREESEKQPGEEQAKS